MPKIDRIVGKAVSNISDAADAIGHAASRVGERLSQTRRNLKDHIKLGHTKPKWNRVNDYEKGFRGVDLREYANEPITPEAPTVDVNQNFEPMSQQLPLQWKRTQPSELTLQQEAKSVLFAVKDGDVNTYLADLASFAQHAEQQDEKVAATDLAVAFADLSEESQAMIRANIREMHEAAVARGADPAILRWSESLLDWLCPDAQPQQVQKIDRARIKRETAQPRLASEVATQLLVSMKLVDRAGYDAGLQMLRKVDTNEAIDLLSSSFLELSKTSRQKILKGIGVLHAGVLEGDKPQRVKQASLILLQILKVLGERSVKIERLHATIRAWDAAILGMKVDAYRETWKTLLELKDELGQKAVSEAFTEVRKGLGPEVLKLLNDNSQKLADLAEFNLAEQNANEGSSVETSPSAPVGSAGSSAKTENQEPAAKAAEDLVAAINATEINQGNFGPLVRAMNNALTLQRFGPMQDGVIGVLKKGTSVNRGNLKRIDGIFYSISKGLKKDKEFSDDQKKKIEQLLIGWRLLNNGTIGLQESSRSASGKKDIRAAKAALKQIYPA
jgi:hypothetical protein